MSERRRKVGGGREGDMWNSREEEPWDFGCKKRFRGLGLKMLLKEERQLEAMNKKQVVLVRSTSRLCLNFNFLDHHSNEFREYT